MNKKLWLRAEDKDHEQRTPLTPMNAKELIEHGIEVIVEECPQRIFPINEYSSVGCQLAQKGDWQNAPNSDVILGLKELQTSNHPLPQTHIHFAHCYKGQEGAAKVLNRFRQGEGKLFDLEFLFNMEQKRIAAFGHWAGFMGAAIALEMYHHRQLNHNEKFVVHGPYKAKKDLINRLKDHIKTWSNLPETLIIGALGRCGSGAKELLLELKLPVTLWDIEETKSGGPFSQILEHEILLNCVFLNAAMPPFLERKMLQNNKRLQIISDVSCDPTSPHNPLPIYNKITTLDDPIIRVHNGEPAVDLQAIDHLPTLLPKESSTDFANQLFPYLKSFLLNDGQFFNTWSHCEQLFARKMREVLENSPQSGY